MDKIKPIIANNITALRNANNMTQLELAEKLNYSDKAVSKWERGESVPDIATLIAISDMFDVTLDDLVRSRHTPKELSAPHEKVLKRIMSNRVSITKISIILVWLIAVCVYVILGLAVKGISLHWLSFVYAIPVSMIVWLVFNSVWFNKRRNYLIISLLMWTTLFSLHISFFVFSVNIARIYLLGIPGQIIILLWSRLQNPKAKKN